MGSKANKPVNRVKMNTTSRPDFMDHEEISTLEEMGEFIDRAAGQMAKLEYTEKETFGMRLALEEAIVNAIRHGNQADPKKKVYLRYTIDPDNVLIQIEDEGSGFDPKSLPDPLAPENLERPCGRGVFLIHSYMTWVNYNDKGNCVTLCKERSAE